MHVKGRMHVGKHEKGLRGEYIGATVPVGFILDELREHYIANPVWSPIVATLFRRFHELESFALWFREIYGKCIFPNLSPEIAARSGATHMSRVPGGYTIKGRDACKLFLTNVAYIGHTLYKGHLIRDTHDPIVDEQDFMYAFNMLSDTDLDGMPIERPERTVRYRQHHTAQDSNTHRVEALLAGTRKNGTSVITSPNKNMYVMNYDAAKKETRYRARNFTGFDLGEFSIQVSTIDALIEERLMEHLDPTPLETLPEEQAHAAINRILREVKLAERVPPSSHVVSMQDSFEAVQTQEPTRLTTTDNLREEVQRGIARLDREYDVNFDLMSDKELRENRLKKGRLNGQLADIERKQAYKTQEENDMREAADMLASGTVQEKWHKWTIEKRRKLIRLVTDDVVLEKVADTWLKLTILWHGWITKEVPHQGVLYVDTGYLLRRRSTMIAWAPEENATVRTYYPTARRMDILARLPYRSWASIRSQAVDLKVLRETRLHESDIPDDISLEDMTFMHKHGLTFDTSEQRVWWQSEVCKRDSQHCLELVAWVQSIERATRLR